MSDWTDYGCEDGSCPECGECCEWDPSPKWATDSHEVNVLRCPECGWTWEYIEIIDDELLELICITMHGFGGLAIEEAAQGVAGGQASRSPQS